MNMFLWTYKDEKKSINKQNKKKKIKRKPEKEEKKREIKEKWEQEKKGNKMKMVGSISWDLTIKGEYWRYLILIAISHITKFKVKFGYNRGAFSREKIAKILKELENI